MQLFIRIDPCQAQMTKASRNKRDAGHAAVSPHHVGGSPGSDQHPAHPPAFLDHPACVQSTDGKVWTAPSVPCNADCHGSCFYFMPFQQALVLGSGQGDCPSSRARPAGPSGWSRAWAGTASSLPSALGAAHRQTRRLASSLCTTALSLEGPWCPPSAPDNAQAPSSWRGAGAAPLPAGWVRSQGGQGGKCRRVPTLLRPWAA